MEPVYSSLDKIISRLSITIVIAAIVLLIFLTAISLIVKNASSTLKKLLFVSFVIVTLSSTLFLVGSTIYLNSVSSSGGPVHYHADYEVWKCGEELELEDPEGISNKVGTSTIHEHNDKRIHIEGVLVNLEDASLSNYFRAVGGSLDESMLSLVSHHGYETLKSGDNCADYPNAELQLFLFKVEGEVFRQTKLKDPKNYVISHEQNVPPGDCVIIELDRAKERTDKLCRSFKVAVQTGKLKELTF